MSANPAQVGPAQVVLGPNAAFEARRVLRVEGPDAQRFVQGVVSANVADAEHPLTIAALLSPKGRLQSEVLCLRHSDEQFSLILPEATAQLAYDQLDRFLVMDEVELSFADHLQARLVVANEALLGQIKAKAGALSAEPCRHPAPGLLVFGEAAALNALTREFPTLGPREWQAVRVRTASPAWGYELRPERLPPELGFGYAVAYDKGCFLGQEPLARVKARGRFNWLLTRLSVDGEASTGCAAHGGEGPSLVDADDKQVGELCTWATIGEGSQVLALVKRRTAEAGGELRCPSLFGDRKLQIEATALGEY